MTFVSTHPRTGKGYAADAEKCSAALSTLIDRSCKPNLLIPAREFHQRCGFSYTRFQDLVDRISDVFMTTPFIKKYGFWVVSRFDSQAILLQCLEAEAQTSEEVVKKLVQTGHIEVVVINETVYRK